jgi:hypothetical protein
MTIMSENHRRDAPAINSTKKTSLFEVAGIDVRTTQSPTGPW